jgi:hypothetical protein
VHSERWIALEAVDRSRNVFRAWRCEIGTDLLGAVMMSVTFGWIGADGRTIARTVADQDAADATLRSMLTRRANAPRHIGMGYRVVGTCDARRGTRGVSWRLVSLRADRRAQSAASIGSSGANGAWVPHLASKMWAVAQSVVARDVQAC